MYSQMISYGNLSRAQLSSRGMFTTINNLSCHNNKIRLTLGNGSKNGAIHNKTTANIPQDTTDAICVLPPTVC